MHLLIVLSKIHFFIEQRGNVVVRKWDHLCYLQCGVHVERQSEDVSIPLASSIPHLYKPTGLFFVNLFPLGS